MPEDDRTVERTDTIACLEDCAEVEVIYHFSVAGEVVSAFIITLSYDEGRERFEEAVKEGFVCAHIWRSEKWAYACIVKVKSDN